ncbi:MAG: hypothetical protein AAGJ82_13335, partial [Bacteroidota bacterium]
LFLLFIVPAAYAGAAYINGEDPVTNFKEMVGLTDNSSSSTTPTKSAAPDRNEATSELERLRTENAELRSRIQQLETTISRLEKAAKSENKRQPWGEQSGGN